MIGEGKLVALLAGHDPDQMAYVSMLQRYHRRVQPELPPSGTVPNLVAHSSTIVLDKEASVVLDAPSEVHYIEVARDQTLQRLLTLSAQEDVETLLVPESAGRSLACQLARHATCAVWFVPDGARLRLARVLVPVDFSVRAADSLRAATGLASLSGGRCDVLHVWSNHAVLTHDLAARRLKQQAMLDYARFIEPIDCLKVPVTSLLEQSLDVSRTILRVAHERHSDLIVLTTRGRSDWARLIRPSLVEHVISESEVPVLVLKHFAAPLGMLAAVRHHPGTDLPCN